MKTKSLLPLLKASLFSTFLACYLTSPRAVAGELEFLIYNAPKPLDWTTPGRIVRTSYENTLSGEAHAIGHVNVRLKCGNDPDSYVGMTSTSSNTVYLWDELVRDFSLDSMLIEMPGRFYSKQEIIGELQPLISANRVRSYKLIISEAQCARSKEYLSSYQKFGLDKIYGGLRSDPLLGDGAGCSAFGVSFLRILGLDTDSILKHWRRHLVVNKSLLSTTRQKAKFSAADYLLGVDTTWTSGAEGLLAFDFYDPELMYDWVESQITSGQAMAVKNAGSARGVVTDVSAVPVPTTTIFLLPNQSLFENIAFHESRLGKHLLELP